MDVSIVFVFIFVIIVLIFVLLGGVNIISRFFNLGEDIQIDRQSQAFELAVYSREKKTGIFWSTTGSSEKFSFFVGDNIERVCVLDPQDPADNPAKGWIDEYDYQELIKSSGYSMIYIRKDRGIKGFQIEKLKPEENFCIKSTSDMLLINKGSYVDAKPA